MSTRRVQASALGPRRLSSGSAVVSWTRNPSWLALTAVGDSEQRFRGLVAVFPQGSYLALSAAGNYTVDWGDGSSENVNTGVTALKLYDFNDADLANTNAPVTLTDAGALVERTAHGYVNGTEVRFYNIVSTTGLTTAQVYYVINATANNFQVSTTAGGSAVALTTNGSATLLPYKQAIVNVTPQAGQNLTTFNLNVKHTATNLQAYETGWLDIELSGTNLSASGLTIGGTNVRFAMCERAALRHIGSVTSFASLFSGFRGLRETAITASTSAVTNMSSMFLNCNNLQRVPLFTTSAVTNMSSMFEACRNLTTMPLFNTAAVTNMSRMFFGCSSLSTVPLFNTAAVTNMSNMFENAAALTTMPLFVTSAVTNMLSMFSSCNSLTTVPLFNTAVVTNMSNMFTNCLSLANVPLFNTAAATDMSNMFFNCSSLITIPLLNTAAVTTMSDMLRGCNSLTAMPLLNTAAVTNMQGLFRDCFSLPSVPALNVSAVSSSSNFANIFNVCNSLFRIEAVNFRFTFSVGSCKLGKTELEEIFTNLPTVSSSQTITISNNVGIGTSVTARSTTTTAQSTISTITNTTSLANGMLVLGTGTGIDTGITVSSDVTNNTLGLVAHGLPNGTPVAFAALGTTTGVSIYTIYYVVNTAADTFQVALTAGGAAIDLTGTNSAAVNVRYANYITNIVANTSITTSTPMATSGTNNLDYRTIDTASARLKNWAVTY